jgi:hypothetical protein
MCSTENPQLMTGNRRLATHWVLPNSRKSRRIKKRPLLRETLFFSLYRQTDEDLNSNDSRTWRHQSGAAPSSIERDLSLDSYTTMFFSSVDRSATRLAWPRRAAALAS